MTVCVAAARPGSLWNPIGWRRRPQLVTLDAIIKTDLGADRRKPAVVSALLQPIVSLVSIELDPERKAEL